MSDVEDFMSGAELISAERRRQIERKHWTLDHDGMWKSKELAKASLVYLARYIGTEAWVTVMKFWPWSEDFWRPKDSLKNLVRAGALIAAEIDRLKREGGE